LFIFEPYLSVAGQVGAEATISATISHQMQMSLVSEFNYMFPASLDQIPSSVDFILSGPKPRIETNTEYSVDYDGTLQVALKPAMGINIRLDALGSELANMDVSFSLPCSFLDLQIDLDRADQYFSSQAECSMKFDAIVNLKSATPSCDGLSMSVDTGFSATISLQNP
jgi:hypothetical protein